MDNRPDVEIGQHQLEPDHMKEAEKHLASVKLTRRGQEQPAVQITPPPQCPDEAKSPGVARRNCGLHGHTISVIKAKQFAPTEKEPNRILDVESHLCTKCGFTLNEIRGQ